MIFDNIEFHNVEQMEKIGNRWKLCRIPQSLKEQVNEEIANNTAYLASGVELRFKIIGESVDLFLSCGANMEANVLNIFYGCFQGGWEYSLKSIGEEETQIHIEKTKNLEILRKLTEENHLAFSPEVVRIVLPYGYIYYHRIEGNVEPPLPQEVPSESYLAYGSSITHGSLALLQPYTYVFRIAQRLNMDYINLGFAGTALLEEEMAYYIVNRKDWNVASVELGINMVTKSFTEEEFEERVDKFTKILSSDRRPIFATDIFVTNGGDAEKIERFRRIVKKYAGERLIYTSALDILNNPLYISADNVHPSLWGVEDIVNNWGNVICNTLQRGLK